MDDVDGKHLPPPPDPAQVDATVAGVDANQNGIRDDVELAIFKKYPNSAKIRAAELQYAMELQMELDKVFNTDTLVATVQEASRGHSCVSDSVQNPGTSPTEAEVNYISTLMDARTKEVEDLVFNTELRKQRREENFGYETSHGDMSGPDCDIDPTSLSD